MIVNSEMPESYGEVNLQPEEYCYTVYMPIRNITGSEFKQWHIPDNLKWVEPLLYKIDWHDLVEYNVAYLTAKHMYVDGYQNRPGWHIDGFGGDDVNYIWCSDNPTQVAVQEFNLSNDHKKSLWEMEEQVSDSNIKMLKSKHLYRLDTSVVHRCPPVFETMLRTFVKLSLSNEVYNLKGNASNPLIKSKVFGNKVKRSSGRNHPVGSLK